MYTNQYILCLYSVIYIQWYNVKTYSGSIQPNGIGKVFKVSKSNTFPSQKSFQLGFSKNVE